MKPITLTIDYFRERAPVSVNGCWVWAGSRSTTGYGCMRSGGRTLRPHRVIFELIHGPQGGLHVCHKCDNRLCCNPDHLFAGTRRDNMQDCVRKGRFKTPFGAGENCPRAKLTLEQARTAKADTRPHAVIAAQYGVTKSAIGYLKRGKTWREL